LTLKAGAVSTRQRIRGAKSCTQVAARTGANALANDRKVADCDVMGVADVADETVDVLDEGRKARAVATRPGRAAVTARIPGEHRDLSEREFVHDMLEAPRVLMTTVQQHDGPEVGRLRDAAGGQ
jgi:hypothetical protein